MRAQGDVSNGGQTPKFQRINRRSTLIRRHNVTENGDIGAVDRNGNV
jgi:hypothetical protein